MAVPIKFVTVLKNIENIDFGDAPVFIKFGTDWCKPCQDLSEQLLNIPNSMCYYVNLDSDEFENVMDEYNFTTIPFTIVKYKKDKRNFSGVLSKDNIIEIINNMKNF